MKTYSITFNLASCDKIYNVRITSALTKVECVQLVKNSFGGVRGLIITEHNT